jgi:hypothetical protein
VDHDFEFDEEADENALLIGGQDEVDNLVVRAYNMHRASPQSGDWLDKPILPTRQGKV